MKRMIIFAAAMLLSLTASFAQTGKSIYQKYSDAENVSAVYISPAMFRLIGKIPDLQVEGGNVNLAPVIQSLTGMYLIDSENPSVNATLVADVDKLLSSGRYELLMEVKDSGETVRMYTSGNETTVSSFAMVVVEEGETTFICIDGKMNRADLEGLLASQMAE